MLTHPNFDPIALSIGPVAIRWYGLMYLAAFVAFIVLCRIRARQRPEFGWHAGLVDDALFYGVIGVILGGRLGYVLFYKPGYYLMHLSEIPAVWLGGMSFHGGFLGVLVAMWLLARKHQKGFWSVLDFIAPAVPMGLAFGRLGNFINGELWGRAVVNPESLPWAMIFPQAGDGILRHPSQLYQFAMEGLLLFVCLWLYARKPRHAGMVSGAFLSGYGVCRFLAEFGREPDGFLGLLSFGLSMGQWLSVPMVLGGIGLLAWADQMKRPVGDVAVRT